MAHSGLIDPGQLPTLFERVAPALCQYPAVDQKAFRLAVERVTRDLTR